METPNINKELQTILTDLNEEQLVNDLIEQFKALPGDGMKIISLVAGPAAGKGTLADMLASGLGSAAVLSTDNYNKGDRKYRRINIEDPGKDPLEKYDFDFLRQQVKDIAQLKPGEFIGVPEYDAVTGIAIGADPNNPPSLHTYSKKVGKVDYLIIEGDFQPLKKEDGIDCLVYLDVADDVRLANRINRDLQERGESNEQAVTDNFRLRQETQFIPHTLPNRDQADIVIKVNASMLSEPAADRKFDYKFDLLKRT